MKLETLFPSYCVSNKNLGNHYETLEILFVHPSNWKTSEHLNILTFTMDSFQVKMFTFFTIVAMSDTMFLSLEYTVIEIIL
jgi:hypothetical protein